MPLASEGADFLPDMTLEKTDPTPFGQHRAVDHVEEGKSEPTQRT